nr:hypothetical protein PanWU01x14_309560 [Ipomoea batatas]GME00770.1 hypothetical protein PanWU01x14_309560 [Ipomoea batatas]GME14474.1 hypothetical protein PanWU01x14_309560 [Ipomoea batatas]GME21142.1 hypothetical protein PanWU01x14_309560 [Ipomoea batatas]
MVKLSPKPEKKRMESIHVISRQSCSRTDSSGKDWFRIDKAVVVGPRKKPLNVADIPGFSGELLDSGKAAPRKAERFETDCLVPGRETTKHVTVLGTGNNCIFQAYMIPQLPPPPPRTAQKVSSPMAFRSSVSPSAVIRTASRTLSAARPYFLDRSPNPPPAMWPPAPTVGQEPAEKPWAAPAAEMAWYVCPSVAPPSTQAVPASTSTETPSSFAISMITKGSLPATVEEPFRQHNTLLTSSSLLSGVMIAAGFRLDDAAYRRFCADDLSSSKYFPQSPPPPLSVSGQRTKLLTPQSTKHAPISSIPATSFPQTTRRENMIADKKAGNY